MHILTRISAKAADSFTVMLRRGRKEKSRKFETIHHHKIPHAHRRNPTQIWIQVEEGIVSENVLLY